MESPFFLEPIPEDLPELQSKSSSVYSYDELFSAQTPDYLQHTIFPPSNPKGLSSRFHAISTTIGKPLDKVCNALGAEGWWPSTGQRECEKAARILHSFTKTGTAHLPRGPAYRSDLTSKSLIKIPRQVLKECAGLAIFTSLRAGAGYGALSAGSGIVVARLPDGSWSAPSTFIVSNAGIGVVVGIDIYHCVCVLNTKKQVQAFTKPRVSLGGESSLTIGPLGFGGGLNAALGKTVRPIWTYTKTRGVWAGVQVEGTVIIGRADANAVLYNREGLCARRILSGEVGWPAGSQSLYDILQAINY